MAGLVIGSSIGVVVMRNPIYSALCLVLNLMMVAGLYAMMEAHFLAVVQIIVYAGAIMVLVIFVLMLLNIRSEISKPISVFLIGVSGVVGIAFLCYVIPIINEAFRAFGSPAESTPGTIKEIGRLLYTKYVFGFQAAAMLLLAAMVGAVMLAKRRAR